MSLGVLFCEEEQTKWRREVKKWRSAGRSFPVVGWLVGSSLSQRNETSDLLVLSSLTAFTSSQVNQGDLTSEVLRSESRNLRALLPGGLTVVGCYFASPDDATSAEDDSLHAASECASRLVSTLRDEEASLASSPPSSSEFIVVEVRPNERDVKAYTCSHGRTATAAYRLFEGGFGSLWSSFWASHRLLSLSVSFHLQIYCTPEQGFEAAVHRTLQPVASTLLSPSSNWVLRYLTSSGQGSKQSAAVVGPGAPGPAALETLLGTTPTSAGAKGKSKADVGPTSGLKTIPPGVVATLVSDPAESLAALVEGKPSASLPHAPSIRAYTAPASTSLHKRRVQLCALACAPLAMAPLQALRSLLAPASAAQIRVAECMLTASHGSALGSKDPKICAYPFCPEGLLHPVTGLYSLAFGEAQSSSVEQRKALHRCLGLPLDRPLLRVANALSLALADSASASAAGKEAGARRLQDVHLGLPPSGIPGAKVWQVQGSYDYYHYMQDRIDDSGWGCAYRSLQTIVSWFRHQQYTSVEVPSHRKIQETLVEIGDKNPNFLGSSQWIGAIELSYVLDQLLGVSCKVLTVQSGADMPTKARELARHFETQGTPVMIGGGVLAYTLLGIDYNELTGECAFLILDPHYMGGEDLKSIRNGGWCGWKKTVTAAGKDFFVRDAFYNLLLPQRPQTV